MPSKAAWWSLQSANPFGMIGYPTPASVIAEIKKRRGLNLTLYYNHLVYGDEPDAALPFSGKDFFGSWTKALLSAGINHQDYAKKRRQTEWTYPDKKAIAQEIMKRRRIGLPINSYAVQSGKDRNYCLLKTANRLYGCWNAALADAGLNVNVVRAEYFRQRAASK